MGFRVVDSFRDGFTERHGLEGPFRYPSGRVLYYDPHEGRYWDPRTDFFLEHDEVAMLQQQVFDAVSGR